MKDCVISDVKPIVADLKIKREETRMRGATCQQTRTTGVWIPAVALMPAEGEGVFVTAEHVRTGKRSVMLGARRNGRWYLVPQVYRVISWMAPPEPDER